MPQRKYYLFESILIFLGAIIGIFSSQFSYFELDKKISLSDLFIFSLTSLTALYIANNINKKLSRLSTIKALYQEDIKSIINHSKQLEDWIETCSIPTSGIIPHMKQCNMKLRSLNMLYFVSQEINTSTLPEIITKYNDLKAEITGLNTTQNGFIIPLLPSQSIEFLNKWESIKLNLLSALINA